MSALQPIALPPMALGRDHGVPGLERACAQLSLVRGPEPMPADGKQIRTTPCTVRERCAWGLDLKATHPALPLARSLVGDLGKIVGVFQPRGSRVYPQY